ncbi:hypothetical protein N0V88_007464 [Collariella sp. IMI 366227]|nr:hypothetical protein N0V88_007464 [Collariella sp. IMI 366227]
MTRLWPVLLALALPAVATDVEIVDTVEVAETFNTAATVPRTCKLLAAALPNQVSFPNTASYDLYNAYWSTRQENQHPACFVAPRKTDDVSKAIKILTLFNTPFAVRAGGHTPFEGGSNTANGVTITLAHLNMVEVSADRKTVSVGSGNRWVNVSSVLDPMGLAVVGGRAATVGVGGLELGGGISYFTGRYGWACDNVRRYEVVLASGSVVTASPTENKDLYWALRGGGGTNFGVVTRFDLVSFEQGKLWASSSIWRGEATQTMIKRMHELLVTGFPADHYAHSYFVMGYAAKFGGWVVLTDQYHSSHTDVATVPAAFASWHNETEFKTIKRYTRMATVSEVAGDIAQAPGSRQTFWATSVKATDSPQLLLDIRTLFEGYVDNLRAAMNATGGTVVPYLIYQAVSTNILKAMEVNGGNALGLKLEDGPVMIIQLTLTWDIPALDDAVENGGKEFIDQVDALAASRNARSKNGFIYMNYAGKTQDVLASYGKENHERLKRVSRKYDPQGKLGKLWKGYFKV